MNFIGNTSFCRRRTHSDSDSSENALIIDTDVDDASSSLPDISDDRINDQVTLLKQEMENLKTNLKSAHQAIESLSFENTELKRLNSELLKKNKLFKTISSSPTPKKKRQLTQNIANKETQTNTNCNCLQNKENSSTVKENTTTCTKKPRNVNDKTKQIQPKGAEYAELASRPISERSAADTEAAHELLSLAHSVPPLPPAAVFTVLHAPEAPLVPLYTYTIQPTNIFIIAEEPPKPIIHTIQAVAPLQPIEYTAVEGPIGYVAYQPSDHIEDKAPVPVAPVVPVVPVAPAPTPTPVPPPQTQPQHVPDVEPDLEPEPETDIEVETTPLDTPTKEKAAKFDCNECGKCYATSSNLSRHKQTHRSLDSGSAKRCGECGKAYVSMPALAMHVLTHRMGHVCGVCGKQFSRPWLLRGHLRSHTGEKPYNCAACGKAFADRSNLRAHLQTHSADKKYECARCRKTFALKSYLNKHQESACVRSDGE